MPAACVLRKFEDVSERMRRHSWPAIERAILLAAEQAKTRQLRTMRMFAEQEIVLPSGPYRDQRLKLDRNPWGGVWLDAVDSGNWRRFNLTGVSQGGKTLFGSALPVMYHLFECRETVIYAAPTLDMAADKWKQDVLPVILASRYRDLLPVGGSGSRGGTPTSIQFKHGPTLRFMTGGGSDKVRAGFTSRAVVVTETDGMDDAGESSRETDKIGQLEARSNAFGDRARLYLECTVSTEEGRTWRELKEGTDSRIVMPCPKCGQWVSPDREHLVGWHDAASVMEARERAMLVCPKCGEGWSEEDRLHANRLSKLVHKGQDVLDDGTVAGLMPKTLTLAMRFSAVNNMMVTMARVAEQEWSAPRRTDADLADKELRQFYWAIPSEPETQTISEIDSAAIAARSIDIPRGRVPSDATKLTIGIDIGKWLCHWVAVAWRNDGTPHVVEYGRLEPPSQTNAVEVAILTALRQFRDEICATGWPSLGEGGNVRPSLTLLDARDWTTTVKSFAIESGAAFIAAQGHSVTRVTGKWAADPGYDAQAYKHDAILPINADLWKSFVHARFQTPCGQPGGLTLFHDTAINHLSFAKHMIAERRREEFVAGKGVVTYWEAVSRNNHYLDALSMACAAGHGVGVRLGIEVPQEAPRQTDPNATVSSDWMSRMRAR